MGKSLEEIFTEDSKEEKPEAEEPKAETEEAPEKAESEEQVQEPEPEEPAKSEDDSAESEPEEEPKTVPLAALHEERDKHRDTRKRFDDLAEQMGQLLPHLSKLGQPEKKDEPEEAAPNFSEDPEGFVTHALGKIQSGYQTDLATAVMTVSENAARARHEDYDDMLGEFAKLTKDHPVLKVQVRQQPDPAEWAYQVAKQHKEHAEIGDPVAYRAKLREELLAEIQAEQPDETPAPIPKSLANARNVGGGKKRTTTKTFDGPTPLDKVLSGVPGRAKS